MAMRAALFTSLAGCAAAHCGLVSPPSRVEPASNAIYYYSQGCFIGCENASGTSTVPVGLCQDMEGTVDPSLLAHPGSPSYKNHPWHAPGYAPLFSPCGNYQGTLTSGMDGRDISDGPLTEWKLGSVQEIRWNIIANHKGGYAVRLCSLTEELTEECFQRYHLPFEGDEHERTTTGTYPRGSQWTKVNITGLGDVVDYVKVQGMKVGKYVMSLRWDCEETPQIWAQCANINIVMSEPEYFYQTITPSRDKNLCVELPDGDTTNGNKLWLWECSGLENQAWLFTNSKIRYAPDPSKCIDGGNTANASQLVLWECDDTPPQRWGYDSNSSSAYLLADTRTCLDFYADQKSNGQPLHMLGCTGDWNQEWSLWDKNVLSMI